MEQAKHPTNWKWREKKLEQGNGKWNNWKMKQVENGTNKNEKNQEQEDFSKVKKTTRHNFICLNCLKLCNLKR